MMTLYFLIYWLNLIFAVLITMGVYYLASNEVKIARRRLLVSLVMCCVIEFTILMFFLPVYPGQDISERFVSLGMDPDLARRLTAWLVSYGVTLLFAKFILKPPWLALVIYNVVEMREKIKKAKPHGQVETLLPVTLGRLHKNQEAAAKGKLDEAVTTAKAMHDGQETVRKLTDSWHGEGQK